MYHKSFSKQFKRSFRKLVRSGRFNRGEIEYIVNILAEGKKLDQKYKDHSLSGEYLGYRECHIRPDLLLIYQIKEDILILSLIDIGSHSELFG